MSIIIIGSSYNKVVTSRLGVICRAATSGVVPPDTLSEPYEAIGPDGSVTALAAKFDDFKGVLKASPPVTDSTYKAVVEENSKVIWEYAKDQASKKLIGKEKGFTGDVGILFDQTAYYTGTPAQPYTTALSGCRKVFARGAWKPFWAAIGLKVQLKRDQEQRINPSLGLTEKEFGVIKDNLVYIGRGFGYSARTTQSAAYIYGTPLAQKRVDQEAFEDWYKSKSHPLTYIVRLNISDVPFGYAPKEVQAFERNPGDTAARKALEGKLLSLQKDALAKYRAEETAGTIGTWSVSEWLASK